MTIALRILASLALIFTLASCVGEEVWAPDDAISQATYIPGGAPTVTLITSINTRNNSGAHSSLLIDGATRLLFDPAGSWHNPGIPERNDVLHGMAPPYMDLYLAFQSDGVFEVNMQTVAVSPEVAAQLQQAVSSYGAVAPAYCSRSITEILSQTPGFETITPQFFPLRTMEQFGQLAGVTETYVVGTVGEDE